MEDLAVSLALGDGIWRGKPCLCDVSPVAGQPTVGRVRWRNIVSA